MNNQQNAPAPLLPGKELATPTGYEVGWVSRTSLDVVEQILSLCPPVEVPPTFYCNQYMALAQKGLAYHHLSKECGTEVL